jgi:hypothetical protein
MSINYEGRRHILTREESNIEKVSSSLNDRQSTILGTWLGSGAKYLTATTTNKIVQIAASSQLIYMAKTDIII